MAGKVLNINVCSPLKLRSGLTGMYHAICHYSYNLPLLASVKNQTQQMNIDFDNIFGHVIPLDNFRLKWRFTDERFDKFPDQDIDKLRPLDSDASTFLWNFIAKTDLHRDTPFKDNFFTTIDNTRILDNNGHEIKKWLNQLGFPSDKLVFLSWDNENAMIVPWELLVKYYDSFYYPSSDDLTVIDQSLDWALLFFHNDEIYLGTNRNRT